LIPLDIVDETSSTQDLLASSLKNTHQALAILARHQTAGRGRLDRAWLDSPGEDLCLSLFDPRAQGHPAPWLVGMRLAVLAAERLEDEVQWPNDLVAEGRKVGGILAENRPVAPGESALLLGVGINLRRTEFPSEIADRAVSLLQVRGAAPDPESCARALLDAWSATPIPTDWAELKAAWTALDATPGKSYRSSSGRRVVAAGIGELGELIDTDGERHFAADAWQI